MVLAAMIPKSDVQADCALWLESYFKNYGDFAPNKNEVRLLIMQKKDVFNKYCHDFKLPVQRPVVSRAKFYELWDKLFPNCVSRPWCDVPGKCYTCYEIDRLRRTSDDAKVQEKLKEAHHLHRGGLFMLERDELLNVLFLLLH